VINASVPGTGPVDHLGLLPLEARRVRPRLVVETIFVGNDFADVAFGGARQFEVDDGLLIRKPFPGEPQRLDRPYHWLRRSHLLQLLRAVQFSLARGERQEQPRTWDAWMREFAAVHLANPPARVEASLRQTLGTLDRTLAVVRRNEAQLVLIVIPRSFQVDTAELEQMRAELGWSERDLDLDRPQQLLADWAAAAGVPIVDPLPRFRAHWQTSAEPLFYTPDAHLTPAGHRLIAEESLPTLLDRLRTTPIR
jgi:hypothetical protein